jgi:phosphate-selective porin OprO/OprP
VTLRGAACLAALLGATAARADPSIDPYFMMETDALVHSAVVEGENGFAIRRLRLGLEATPVPWLTAVAIVEYASGVEPNVHIWEGYLDVTPWGPLHLSFGFRRTPLFHIAKDELFEAMAVPELPVAVRAFWPDVDLGFEAHYLASGRAPIEAWLRVGNGSGTPLGNDSNELAYEGRIDLVLGRPRLLAHCGRKPALPADGLRPEAEACNDFFGLRVGVGGHVGTLQNESGVEGTTADDYVFFRPVTVNGLQSIGEGHVAAWLGRLTLDVEGAYVNEQRGQNAANGALVPLASVDSWGGFAEVAYMIAGTPRVPGGWPNQSPWNTVPSASGLEVAGRFDYVEFDHGASDVTGGGAKGGELAVRWWATRFLALSVAGYYLRYDVAPIEEPTQLNSWLALARATFHWG